MSTVDELFANASDAGFKARAINEYNRIARWVQGHVDLDKARVMDFGCGVGIAASSFALRHPESIVYGCDIVDADRAVLAKMLKQQTGLDLPSNFRMEKISENNSALDEKFDLIFAWSVCEHINEKELPQVFSRIRKSLAPDGRLFLQVNPLYFSSRGSHLYGAFEEPWHHLLLNIAELHDRLFESHGERANRSWRQFIELNRLTDEEIIGYAEAAGLKCLRKQMFEETIQPPESLLKKYQTKTLMTSEFMALFSR